MTYVPSTSSRFRRSVEVNLRAIHRRAWRAFRPTDARPIFLIGCGRSGTDLIVENLSRSPELDVYNETHPKAFDNWRLREDSVIRDLIKNSRATGVLLKPIVQTHHAQRMLNFSSDSKLVFACRNPWDTINSMIHFFPNIESVVRAWAISAEDADYPLNATPSLRRSFIGLYSDDCTREEMGALSWWTRNALYMELQLQKSGRVHVVDYDAVVENPEQEFRRLSEFLGIGYRRSMTKGVSAGSRGKNAPPQLRDRIRSACEDLWSEITVRSAGHHAAG